MRNEELNNFYSSPSIIRMIRSRRMRWAWHVGRVGEKRNVNFLAGSNLTHGMYTCVRFFCVYIVVCV
jgi:hypothetical protein